MENNEVVYLYLDDIIPNRFQPREVFDDQALKELAVSIKEHGVIQPIIVRKVENKYEIIAGERRYKASTMAGLTKIPAIVKNLNDQESSKVALIENLQRRDLTPIEEARTYQKILELEPGMTQEQLAQTMGKTQSVVSNKLRLLALPEEVQDALLKEKISERHARSLLNLTNKNDQIKMLDKVVTERMTVRELDKEIKEMNDNNGQASMPNGNMNTSSSMYGGNVVNNSPVQGNNNPFSLGNGNPFANSVAAGGNETTFSQPTELKNEPVSSNPAVTPFNPTSVDINKIRENAVDIGGPKTPTVDIKDLMKDVSSEPKSDFKFVPTFDFPKSASLEVPTNDVPTSPMTPSGVSSDSSFGTTPSVGGESRPSFGDLFGNSSSGIGGAANNNISNMNASTPGMPDVSIPSFSPMGQVNTGVNSNSNVASSMGGTSAFSLNTFAPTKKDVTVAVTDIKEAVKTIESKGYHVSVEENDSDNTYQITIKVSKND